MLGGLESVCLVFVVLIAQYSVNGWDDLLKNHHIDIEGGMETQDIWVKTDSGIDMARRYIDIFELENLEPFRQRIPDDSRPLLTTNRTRIHFKDEHEAPLGMVEIRFFNPVVWTLRDMCQRARTWIEIDNLPEVEGDRRTWHISKTVDSFKLYCEGVLVGEIQASDCKRMRWDRFKSVKTIAFDSVWDSASDQFKLSEDSEWEDVTRIEVALNHDMEHYPLLINSRAPFEKATFRAVFYSENRQYIGSIKLDYKNSTFAISQCTEALNLGYSKLQNLPESSSQTLIWKVFVSDSGIRIECNDVVVAELNFADVDQDMYVNCVSRWTRDLITVRFLEQDSMTHQTRQYEECTAGYYLNTDGECEECQESTYSGDAAVECEPCPAGRHSAAGSISAAFCIPDLPPTSLPMISSGFAELAACDPGNYYDLVSYECILCPQNTYNYAAATCIPCAAGLSAPEGSSFESDCVGNWLNAGNCWTSECDYCSNTECALKYDLTLPNAELTVRSVLKRKYYNNLIFYNAEGDILGSFRWSLRGFFLSHCTQCRPHVKINHNRGLPTEWTFSLKDGVATLVVGDDTIFHYELLKKCANHYKSVAYVAFHGMSCDLVSGKSEMKQGSIFQSYQDAGYCGAP